jgi:hypothetical protein
MWQRIWWWKERRISILMMETLEIIELDDADWRNDRTCWWRQKKSSTLKKETEEVSETFLNTTWILLSAREVSKGFWRWWMTQNYWVFGILENRGHDVPETRSVSKVPNWVGVFLPHLKTETDPISETSCPLLPRIPDDGKSPKTQ